MDKTLIIIPTYNEVENIEKLYLRIKKFSPRDDILFVDDSSSDGTIDNIKKIMKIDSTVNILIRKNKEGLGRAYLDGFRWGLKKDYDWFQQLDADLSHDPQYLPLFDCLKSECDVIIASRYLKEEGIKKWNYIGRPISYFGCLYLRLLFRNTESDLTGGFNCWRRKVLQKIDFSKIISWGFLFQAELKFLASRKGFKIKEFPYTYKEREFGESKLNLSVILEGLISPYLIRLKYGNFLCQRRSALGF